MSPSHVQTLTSGQLRRSVQLRHSQSGTVSSIVDLSAAQNGSSYQRTNGGAGVCDVKSEPVNDPLIFPGLYSPSGFDLMGILVSNALPCSFVMHHELQVRE